MTVRWPGRALVDAYRPVLRSRRRRARTFVVLVALSTLFEGLAVAMLVPLLSHADHYDVLGHTYDGSTVRGVALGVFVVVGVCSALLRYLAENTALRFLADVEQELREDITALLLRMSWSSFLSLRLGDINASTLVAANQIAIGAHFLLRAIGAVIAAVILAAVSFAISPGLSAAVVLFGLAAAALYRAGVRRADEHARVLTTRADNVGTTIAELFGNLKFFQSTGELDRSEGEAAAAYADYAGAWYRSQRYTPLVRVWFEVGAVVLIGAVLALVLIVAGELTPTAVASLALFSRLVPRITVAQEWLQNARIRVPWLESWNERASRARAADRPRGGEGIAPTYEQVLCADAIRFAYPTGGHDVLDGVSWTLPRGGMLALVGGSGSGKTTMLDLVTGVLAPTSGSLALDGVTLDRLDLDRWQRRIGLVTQHAPLLHKSVFDNVCWTEAERDPERVRRALEQANAAAFVDAMPSGVHTVVGEAGAALSGGQRQRLALARALYRQPWLLVLDEPTSALDADSEDAIVRALEDLHGRCSILLATHRPRAVRAADEILVLAAGRVSERGTFAELAASPTSEFARVLAVDDPTPAP